MNAADCLPWREGDSIRFTNMVECIRKPGCFATALRG